MNEIYINDVIIQYDAGNVRILNSYKIKKTKDMINILIAFLIMTNYKSKRHILSWITEWKAHNRLYRLGLFRNHTKDCDLEENEKRYRLLSYQIIGR